MEWLIKSLFGGHALAHLGDKVRAAIAQYILANPGISETAVIAWVSGQSDGLIAQVLVHFPGWAVIALTNFLNAEIAKLADAAYKSVQAAVVAR